MPLKTKKAHYVMTAAALAVAAVSTLAVPAQAHHSFAMFDRDKQVTIKGTVKQFQWTNPHIWVQVMVPDEKGVAQEWSIEGASPNMLFRQGMDNHSFKAGEQVSLVINPLKNGGHGGNFISAAFADGRTLGGRGGGRAPG